MKWRGLQQLKANEKKGISMAIVLCVSAFFIAFAAAILYTAGLITAQSNRRLKEERCYQLAKSYAKVLDGELKNTEDSSGQSFYRFANKFLDDTRYAFYNDDTATTAEATKYRFVPDGTDFDNLSQSTLDENGYGNLCILLSKEQVATVADELTQTSGEITVGSDGSYDTVIMDLQNIKVRQYVLHVEVTAYYEDASYTYSTEYTREETYNVSFTYGDKSIVWVPGTDGMAGSWRYDNSSGAVCTPDVGSKIQYQYQTENPLTRTFVEDEGATIITGGGSDENNE